MENNTNHTSNSSMDRTRYIAQAAMTAAIYTVLTVIAAGFDLASGAIQVRFSEALAILPVFTPAATAARAPVPQARVSLLPRS